MPTTLADFHKAATKLKTDGDKNSGLWLPGQDWRNGISWIFANGGDIASRTAASGSGSCRRPRASRV